jgi:transcriptional regulator with XRE-family HTH domain
VSEALEQAIEAYAVLARRIAVGDADQSELIRAAELVAAEARADARRDVAGWGTTLSLGQVVGWRVAGERAALGWSQRALADQMCVLGFSWTRLTVNDVEAARRRISYDELFALASLAEVTIVDLLTPPSDTDLDVTVGNGGAAEVPAADAITLISGGEAQAIKHAADVARTLLRRAAARSSDEDGR